MSLNCRLLKMNAEIDYLIYLLNAKHLRKGEEGLRDRLRHIEKEMLDKGGMHLKVNNLSTITHAAKDGRAICGARPLDSYMRVGVRPTCRKCLMILNSKESQCVETFEGKSTCGNV